MLAQVAAVFAKYGAESVRVFGSVARGTARPGSDVDFLAKFPTTFSFFDLVALETDLEALIGIPVDVVSDDPRNGSAIEQIRRTAVPLEQHHLPSAVMALGTGLSAATEPAQGSHADSEDKRARP